MGLAGDGPPYWSSLTCSSQLTTLPSSCSWMAIWVMAVVAEAPCQCFSPGGNQTTSPGRISSIGPPQRRARPHPAVTIRVWPSGWVCHAVRAPGSNVTLAPAARAGAWGWNSRSIRTVPVNQSAGPLADGCEPTRAISMIGESSFGMVDPELRRETSRDGERGAAAVRNVLKRSWWRLLSAPGRSPDDFSFRGPDGEPCVPHIRCRESPRVASRPCSGRHSTTIRGEIGAGRDDVAIVCRRASGQSIRRVHGTLPYRPGRVRAMPLSGRSSAPACSGYRAPWTVILEGRGLDLNQRSSAVSSTGLPPRGSRPGGAASWCPGWDDPRLLGEQPGQGDPGPASPASDPAMVAEQGRPGPDSPSGPRA